MKKTTEIGRRGLIAGAAAAAGLAAVAAPARAAGLAGVGGRPSPSLATAGADAWRAAVGTLFAADTDAGRVPLKLVGVERLDSGPARPGGLARDHGFALSFELPGTARLAANRAYRLTGPGLAPSPVFFSSGTKRLTAIFN